MPNSRPPDLIVPTAVPVAIGNPGAAERRDLLYDETIRHFFSPVIELLNNPAVTEVMINGWREVFYEQDGRVRPSDARFDDEHALGAAVRNLAEYVGRRIDEHTPTMDARLPKLKFRVNVIGPPVSRRRRGTWTG